MGREGGYIADFKLSTDAECHTPVVYLTPTVSCHELYHARCKNVHAGHLSPRAARSATHRPQSSDLRHAQSTASFCDLPAPKPPSKTEPR